MTSIAGLPLRVVGCVAGAQLLGFGIGALWGAEIGVAVGCLLTLPGFLLGRAWHKEPFPHSGKLLGIAIGLSSFVAVVEIPLFMVQARALAELKRLDVAAFKRVDILDFDTPGGKPLVVSGDEALAAFVRGCAEATSYSPDHPRYQRRWSVVLLGDRRIELRLHLEARDPETVFGSIVEIDRPTFWDLGDFQSRALRPWVARYLESSK